MNDSTSLKGESADMNYEETRRAAQMRIAEMASVLERCGLKLRDEYTLDEAI